MFIFIDIINYFVYNYRRKRCYNEKEELNLYISSYNKDDIEVIVKEIEDNEEYNKIKIEINKILLTIKNESDKLD